MVDEKNKKSCSGCSACISGCPNKCIEMKMDEQGFNYPVIKHNECIECGLCDIICEKISEMRTTDSSPDAFGAFAKDDDIRMNSSSGGVFSIISKKILEENGVVIGAAMSTDCYSVEHIAVCTLEDLWRLRGSKYVQSRMNDMFSQVRLFLEEGKKVLFSGTACQVNGLKAFLGREYNNLLCIDFICHGVASEKTWRKYCQEIENQTKCKIIGVNFRHKKYSWEHIKTAVQSGDCNLIYRSKEEDPFLRLYLKNFYLRPSCYECLHKGMKRNSDITIADFWGVRKVNPGLSDGKGVSLILLQSEKGNQYINSISNELVIQKTDAEAAINYNKAAINSVRTPDKLDVLWSELEEKTILKLAEKYTPISLKKKTRLVLIKSPIYGLLKKRNKEKTNMENGLLFSCSSVKE